MEFRFKNDTKPIDFWILSMSHTYRSMVGVCNIVFTVAVIAATIRLMGSIHDLLEVLLLFGCFLFTVIQPSLVYLRARAQVAGIPKDMELLFDGKGMHVAVGMQHETIPWKRIKNVIEERNMIMLSADGRHGYILTNRAMNGQREEFLRFLETKVTMKT